jgi:hypothetical protein
MMTKQEVVDNIATMTEEVTAAREGLLKGEIIPIKNVNEYLDQTCQDALELEPEDAISLKPSLDALLEDLQTLSAEVEYIQNKVAAIHKEQAAATE